METPHKDMITCNVNVYGGVVYIPLDKILQAPLFPRILSVIVFTSTSIQHRTTFVNHLKLIKELDCICVSY